MIEKITESVLDALSWLFDVIAMFAVAFVVAVALHIVLLLMLKLILVILGLVSVIS